MNTPFFSVVIPTKGRSFLVGGAIESVLRQTFPDLEIIVADNDDGDATQQAVAKFKDPRVRYHRTGNLTMPDNWDAGMAAASGEYVLLLADKQALKFHALETIHRALERERAECLRWLCDVFDDTRRITFLYKEKADGTVTLIPSEEIVAKFATERMSEVGRFLPLGHFSGFSQKLLRKIKDGPHKRLCPPTNPDYTIAFQSLAYADAVLFFNQALGATSMKNSNGRSALLKGGLSRQFIRELGGRQTTYAHVPIKAFFVHNCVYNDYVELQQTIPGRLAKHPLNWSNYFIDCYLDIQEGVKRRVDMSDELAAWSRALNEQTTAVQQSVRTELDAQHLALKKSLRHSLKEFRRVTGISRLEWAIKDRLHALTGRNLTGRFATPLDYVKWEHEQPRSQN